MAKVEESPVTLDTTDVDRHLGQPVGGGQLKEPVAVNDIRRWVQGMHYPNPLHYDDTYADASTGEICALFGSTDHLEIAANGASAAVQLGLDRGALVHVARRA